MTYHSSTAKEQFYQLLDDELSKAGGETNGKVLASCLRAVIDKSPYFYRTFAPEWLGLSYAQVKNMIES